MDTARFVFSALALLLSVTLNSSFYVNKSLAAENKPLLYTQMPNTNFKTDYQFTVSKPAKGKNAPLFQAEPAVLPVKETKKSSSHSKDNLEEKLLSYIPHAPKMKKIWKLVDGDVDLYMTGLRFNRKNTGVSYETKTIPLLGEIDDINLRFDAGKKNEVSFQSKALPFIQNIDGFHMKAVMNDDHSRIYARYSITLD